MFGKHRRRQGEASQPEVRARPEGVHRSTGAPLPDADFSPGGASHERRLSSFDRLGQTLVATLTVGTLSGPESVDLVAELCEQMKAVRETDTDQGPATAARHVVLDLQNVQYMDSMCIGVMVEFLTKLNAAGGRIALVNTAQNVEYLFKLTRLDRVFPICRDVMKAIEMVEREG